MINRDKAILDRTSLFVTLIDRKHGLEPPGLTDLMIIKVQKMVYILARTIRCAVRMDTGVVGILEG